METDKKNFRKMVEFLSRHVRWYVARNDIDFSAKAYNLAQQFDKGLHARMTKVDAARKSFAAACKEMDGYISSKKEM